MKWKNAWIICRGLKPGERICVVLRFMWKNLFVFRYSNHLDHTQADHIHPGWLIMLVANALYSANKTINRNFVIYLPIVPWKVTDPNPIYEYMLYLQNMNMAAAINAFKVLRTYPETFSNAAIHLEGFHFMKKNFKTNCLSSISSFIIY